MPIWHGHRKAADRRSGDLHEGRFPAVQYADPVPVPGNQGDIAAGHNEVLSISNRSFGFDDADTTGANRGRSGESS